MTVESISTGLIRENEQIVLRCLARGIPQPKISWHIPGKKLFNSRRNDRSNSTVDKDRRTTPSSSSLLFFRLDLLAVDNRLIIKNLSRTSPIDYQCIADNGIPPRDTRTKRLLPSSKTFICLRDTHTMGGGDERIMIRWSARPDWRRDKTNETSSKMDTCLVIRYFQLPLR